MTNPWWMSAKLYELYIDKFSPDGTIAGLTASLDYFGSLGVDTLHLLPHYPSGGIDDGYDVTDYRAVRPELGTLGDFSQLIKEAHAGGLRIMVDFVLNHTSNKHPWFLEASASRQSPKRDFYLWSETGKEFPESPNPFPDFKQNNWIRNEATGDYYFATFYPEQPDLNWDNPAVEEAMWEHMAFWAQMGVDGFRLDAAPHLIKREGTRCKGLPETHAVLKKLRARLEREYPDVVMLAEAHEELEPLKRYFGDGDECHLVYHFPLMEQCWLALMDGDRTRVEAQLEKSGIPPRCQWATFLRNHDELSLATLSPGERKAVADYFDPLHQYPFKKGAAVSLRLASALGGQQERAAEALRMLYTLPGAPVMYYGDEIGMQNLPQGAGADTRRAVRGAFDWAEARRQMDDPSSLFTEAADIVHATPAPATAETEVADASL